MTASDYGRAAADAEHDAYLQRVDEYDDRVSTWAEVDLGPALRGELHPHRPSILRRTDELGLIYAGELNGLHGDSGAGKSWLALVAAVEIIRDGGSVVWVDAEDPTPATLVERLRAAGLDDEQIVAGVAYIAPAEPSDEAAIAQVVRAARARDDVRLVVLDSVGELHALDGVNENSDEDVAPWMRRVARALVELTGAAVLLIDHATKAGDAPLYPSGSKRKRAAITGAQHLVTADPPFARGTPGRLVVTCAKDRHGHHQRGAIVAYVQIRPTANGGIAWTVEPPRPPTPAAERLQQQQRDRELGEQLEVVNALRRARRPLTRTDLGHRVELRRELVPKVVARLVDHGAVVEVDQRRPNAAGQLRTVTVLRLADGTGWQPDPDDTRDDPDGGSR